MKTFADIVASGDNAAAAGRPLVENWVKVRGNLYMFAHACGGLDQCKLSEFETVFPRAFDDLSDEVREAMPGPQTYGKARGAVYGLLAIIGRINDPWEALRILIRQFGRNDIEYHWGGLKTPACAANFSPADLCTEWVWSLDAESKGGFKRQSLRRAVALFNELFKIEDIAASGLLPPSPIGPPPSYDRRGQRLAVMPATLSAYHAASDHVHGKTALYAIWRAISAAGYIDLPSDPSADDLLEPVTWTQIEALPQRITGVSPTSWCQYTPRARAVLLPYATPAQRDQLPDRFERMIDVDNDRWPIRALWRQICDTAPTKVDADPDELLELGTWRDLWCIAPSGVKAATWKGYEARARKILLRYSVLKVDPYRKITRAWADLPTHAKAALNPIRKTAEKTLLMPFEVTAEWLVEQGLEAEQQAEVLGVLADLDALIAREAKPAPDSISIAWDALRSAAKSEGITTIGLNKVASPASQDGKEPSELTPEWAAKMAEQMEHRDRAKFAKQLREVDKWLGNPSLSPLLYSEPIGALPDRRKNGAIEPPPSMLMQVDIVCTTHGRAQSTLNEYRATLRKLYTKAAEHNVNCQSFEGLLSSAVELKVDLRTRRIAARLLKDLEGMHELTSAKRSLTSAAQ